MNIKHYYLEAGSGEPLILLHGNGENCSYFAQQINAFAQDFHVYAPDTRGHGKTPRGDAPFSIRQFADDLCTFMDAHKIEKANILGFSDGGNIALIFALKYPERVDHLIIDGANLYARGVKFSVQLPIELGYRIARLFAKRDPKAASKAEMLGLMVNDPNIDPTELHRISAPTLVLAGTDDMIRKAHTELIAGHIPGSQLHFIKGDHFIAAGNPDEFNRVVLEFLNRK